MRLTAVAAEAEEADQGANVWVHQPECLERQSLQVHATVTLALLHAGCNFQKQRFKELLAAPLTDNL